MAVTIEEYTFLLLPKRGVYWPAQKTLFIADTHFGKEATFRSQGVPVPRGSTSGTMRTIAEMILECQATRLILLGDMFHARSSISQDIRDSMDAFFDEHSNLRFTLVLGNHDRNVRKLLVNWPIEIVDSMTSIGRITISHIPNEPSQESDLLLCGHIHPSYRFQSKFESLGKLPCFWLSKRQLILPAIGEFTGTHVIKSAASDRVWVIAGEQIIEVSNGNAFRTSHD